MEIISVDEVCYQQVEMSDGNIYERYGPDNWRKWYGESTEMLWGEEEAKLEEIYQAHIRRKE